MTKNKLDWPVCVYNDVDYNKLWNIVKSATNRVNDLESAIIDVRNYYFGYLSALYKYAKVITKTEYCLLSYLFYYTPDEPLFFGLTANLDESDKHHFFWQCHMALRDYRQDFVYE